MRYDNSLSLQQGSILHMYALSCLRSSMQCLKHSNANIWQMITISRCKHSSFCWQNGAKSKKLLIIVNLVQEAAWLVGADQPKKEQSLARVALKASIHSVERPLATFLPVLAWMQAIKAIAMLLDVCLSLLVFHTIFQPVKSLTSLMSWHEAGLESSCHCGRCPKMSPKST